MNRPEAYTNVGAGFTPALGRASTFAPFEILRVFVFAEATPDRIAGEAKPPPHVLLTPFGVLNI